MSKFLCDVPAKFLFKEALNPEFVQRLAFNQKGLSYGTAPNKWSPKYLFPSKSLASYFPSFPKPNLLHLILPTHHGLLFPHLYCHCRPCHRRLCQHGSKYTCSRYHLDHWSTRAYPVGYVSVGSFDHRITVFKSTYILSSILANDATTPSIATAWKSFKIGTLILGIIIANYVRATTII